MPRFWKPMSIQEINKKLDPEKKAKIDGNQNKPSADATALVKPKLK